jgi:6-phosphogluconolactonase
MTEKETRLTFRIPIFVAVLMIPILFIGVNESYSEGTFVYVSNGEDGDIAVMELNPETGYLKMVEKVPAGPNVKHMALSPDHRFLYASVRSEPFSVITYLINSETGNLTQISREPLPENMVYISVDQTGRFLLSVSNKDNDAIIAVNPIGLEGFVQSVPAQVISTGPNPHSILVDPSNRFVYVPHLGNGQVKQFLFNQSTGVLSQNDPSAVYTKDGSGPRHFDFSPNNRFVYVSNEMDGMVYSYKMDNKTGTLTEIQRISAIPPNLSLEPSTPAAGNGVPGMGNGEVTTAGVADIHITPDGKWLYVSERSTSTIAAFAVDRHSGNLTYIESYDTEKIPRGINIDPRGNFVIAAGQESGHVSVHEINQENGELKILNRYESGKDPNWIEIVEFN